MARTRVEINHDAIRRLLRGDYGRIRHDLDARGRRVMAAAGVPSRMASNVGRNRYRVIVRTAWPMGRYKRERLARALGAARG